MARRIVRVGRGNRSLKTWLGQAAPAFGQDLTPVSGAFSPGLKVFGAPDPTDFTVLRTRGVFQAALAEGEAVGSNIMLALGIGLCTTEASLAGAVPLPFDNPEWDGWFVYQVMPLRHVTDSLILDQSGEQIIDSKAMRKIPAGQVLFLSTQLFGNGTVGGIVVNQVIQVRQLQKTS